MPQQHQTGPLAILEALRGLDLDKLEQEAQEGIRSGTKTARAGYVKRLNAIKGLRRTGVAPAELMVTSIPVIPPKFRPFAQQGDTLIAGDANILYKDFIEQNDAFKQERDMFGDTNAGQGRLDLYDTAKALYGYGDPVKEKTRQKDIRGFLKKIVGRTSKTGYFQSRMISKTQDSVGRSTIIVDPELGMDEIGLPRDMAMTMYAPHVQRRLRQTGMADSDALKAVRDRAPVAMNALEREVEVRPVVYSRAPAWYQHNIIGGNVKLVDGDAISISPAVTSGLSADFDGNCITGRSEVVVKIDAPHDLACARSKSADSPFVTTDYDKTSVKISIDDAGHLRYDDGVMINSTLITKTAEGAVVNMRIEDMPHIESTRRKDKNGADVYDVPEGISVLASTPEGGVRWESVESFTVEDGCDLRRVATSGGKVVECSANESLAAFNPDGGLQRIKPDDAVTYETKVDSAGNEYQDVYFAHAVPVVNKYPCRGGEGDGLDGILGWLIGTFVSDGTFDGKLLTYTKDNAKLRAMFMISLARLAKDKGIMSCAKTYSEMHDAETNYGVGGMSTKIHIKASALPAWIGDLFKDCYDPEGLADTTKRSSLAKRLPGDVTGYSRKKLLGVLAGFLDGDGSISLNRSKKTPQVLCSICTSSTYLRDSVKLLFNMLGIPFKYSVTKPAKGRVQKHDSYVIPVSTEWLYAHMDELPVATPYAALDYLKKNPPHCSAKNRAPMSYKAMQALKEAYPDVTKWKAWATNLSKCKRGGYTLFARDNAQKYAKAIKEYIADWADRPELASVVNAAFDEATGWEYYDTVEAIPTERVYDIGVPGAKVFMLESGLIVYDTINVHVPATDEAVKETYEALMPSAHPYDDRSGDTIKPKLKQEQVLGLYDIATRPASGTYRFATTAEALKAVREGAVPLDADLEVGDLKPVEKQASLVSFINNKAKDIAMTPVSGIMSMELPHSVDSDGDGMPDEITPEEASDMLRELYGIDLPDADASTLRDVQGIVSWLKAHREGEKVAEYVDPSMDMGERTVSGETLKALEMMYGISFPDIMKGGAKAVDVARYLAKECKGRLGLAKEAAGKIMEVAFKNLEQSGEIREKRRGGVVYMPDCEAYRGILSGNDRKAKAKLVQKFVLNQAPGVVYAACDAYVVE